MLQALSGVQLVVGAAAAAAIGWIAYRLQSLTASGALAASFVGTVVLGVGGWPWAVLLLAFFVSSSGLSLLFRERKRDLEEAASKGARRDAGQVFGNGALAALFALLHGLDPGQTWHWVGFAGGLAAVNADTWATELGVLSRKAPRLITHLRRTVAAGTSGGISATGILAAAGGAALIATLATIGAAGEGAALDSRTWIAITAAGVLGSLFDSFLGATVQRMYYCPRENRETEQHPLHSCGSPTRYLRGLGWMNNDVVNFACAALGTVVVLTVSLA